MYECRSSRWCRTCYVFAVSTVRSYWVCVTETDSSSFIVPLSYHSPLVPLSQSLSPNTCLFPAFVLYYHSPFLSPFLFLFLSLRIWVNPPPTPTPPPRLVPSHLRTTALACSDWWRAVQRAIEAVAVTVGWAVNTDSPTLSCLRRTLWIEKEKKIEEMFV